MENFIVTTAVKVKSEMIDLAKQLSLQWKVPFIEREKLTLNQLTQRYGNLFLVYSNRLEYVHDDGTRLFFHPNTAVIRIRNGYDPLSELVGSGKTILDCTMGLASDSIVMAHAPNQVVALEHDPIIYTLVKYGLTHFNTVETSIQKAMHNIVCVHDNFSHYLENQSDNSVDIVYFDPMFSHTIEESTNLQGIQKRQIHRALTQKDIDNAKRVCRESVIIKTHFRDDTLERFGFERQVREYTKFHYGIWRKLQ